MSDYDAIVIGAGHNGLTAAFLLQNAGLRTVCLEANTYAGGMAATVELIDGFRYEIAGSVQFPTPAVVAKELGLDGDLALKSIIPPEGIPSKRSHLFLVLCDINVDIDSLP